MANALLASVEVATGPSPTASVIWLHGLGADGHDFEPAVPQLVRPGGRALRFVFPHAPIRPVTLNGGMPMRAWYDIMQLNRLATEDEAGVRSSDAAVRALIRRENERGVSSENIVLAGFSQGGAMALYTGTRFQEKLAGIIGLSCYMPIAAAFAGERHVANSATPIFMAHGSLDVVVGLPLGEATRAMLVACGYKVDWHTYPMGHGVSTEELAAIAAFIRRVI
jgi:phospholipase/carboxylesterase